MGTVAARVLAVTGPIPGIVASRRLVGLARCQASSSRPSAANFAASFLELLGEHRQDPTRQFGQPKFGRVPDRRDQLRDMARALGRDDAEFGQVAAQGIDRHRPLPHQQVAGAMDGQRRLLRLRS